MACVIAAPSSSSGKTLLSLLLISWARFKGKSIQPFKVGPDYLDPQLLSVASKRPCRNLDLILSNKSWVEKSFRKHSESADLTLIEGVMGLFDGVGSTDKGSTASVAKQLNLPIVLIINAHGQAASLAPLVKGFRDQEPSLRVAGVVLNQVNSERHKKLLEEVLSSIDIQVLGSIPKNPNLVLPSRYLGLIPAHEIIDLEKRIEIWGEIAEKHLSMDKFHNLLKAPTTKISSIISEKDIPKEESLTNEYPIAIAQDKAFHFRYPETKEHLEALGMPLIIWRPTEDEPIPIKCKGLIIPGGFPEQFAKEISTASRSLKSLKSFYGKFPIYAECGGMLLLGHSIKDLNGERNLMTGLLPFEARIGDLQVGYRQLTSLGNSLILNEGDQINGHEFHRWDIEIIKTNSNTNRHKFNAPWAMSGWEVKSRHEGWSNQHLHASWVHLHWPSSFKVLNLWFKAVKNATSIHS